MSNISPDVVADVVAPAAPTLRSAIAHKFRTKRRKTVAAVAALGLVGAGGAVAYFLDRAEIKGGASAGAFDLVWSRAYQDAPRLDPTSKVTVGGTTAPKPGTGVATANDGLSTMAKPANDLTLPTGMKFYPGDAYVFTAEVTVIPGDSTPGIITGLEMPGLGSGFTAEIINGCGAKVVPWVESSALPTPPSVAVPVTIAITADADAVPNGSAWSLSGAGVTATPEGQIPAGTTFDCAPVVGGSGA